MSGRRVGGAPSWALALLLVGCGRCGSSPDDTQPDDTAPDSQVEDTSGSVPIWDDADGDGYTEFYDCDDADPAVHPAAQERCDDIDNDCDGAIDEGGVCSGATELGPDDAVAVFYGVAPGDQAGQHSAGVGDLDGDGFGDLLLPSFAHDDPGDQAGVAYLFLGPVSGQLDAGQAYATYLGEAAGDNAGRTVGPAGDIDGDGVPDLLIGAPASGAAAPAAGAVYVLLGPQLPGERSLALADARILGQAEGDWLGDAEALGDMNLDGFDDVVVASQFDKSLGDDAGVAYVVYGPISGDLSLSDASIRLAGEQPGDQAGSAVAGPGDVTGDGIPDLLVGARYADNGGSNSGAAYLFHGPVTASQSLADADLVIPGSRPGAQLGAGWSLGAAGDHDGDGLGDLIMGGRGDSTVGASAGAAWLLLAADLPGLSSLDDASAGFTAEAAGDLAGTSVCGDFDLDGDGNLDLAIGASGAQGSVQAGAGAAFVILGPVLGQHSLADSDLIFRGVAADDMTGWSVEAAGDVLGLGAGGLLVGALGSDHAGADAGAIYMLSYEVSR